MPLRMPRLRIPTLIVLAPRLEAFVLSPKIIRSYRSLSKGGFLFLLLQQTPPGTFALGLILRLHFGTPMIRK